MEHKINIDKTNRMSLVFHRLDKMRKDPQRCDFRIKVGSEEILAHRNILSANSDYFDAMFVHDTKENKSGEVILEEVDGLCVRKCVDFMYNGEISSSDENLGDLLHVATMMQLREVCEGIAEILEAKLSSESFFIIKKLCTMYDMKKLQERCDQFAVYNFMDISKTDNFGDFSEKEVVNLIKSEKLMALEEVKLDALLKWIKFDSESRSQFVNYFLGLIDVSKLSLGYRRYLIENEDLIRKNLNLVLLFYTTLMDSMNIQPTNVVESTNDERIVVFDELSGHLQCFNPKDKTWTQMHEMNEEMKNEHFSALTVDDCIYVLNLNKKVYRLKYLDKNAMWERMADMFEVHGECPPATVLDNFIYVIGGHNGCSTAEVEKYDVVTDLWEKLPARLQPSMRSEVVVHGEEIYSFGGYIDEQYSYAIDKFDIGTKDWKHVGDIAEARSFISALSLNGKIILCGGFVHTRPYFNTVEQYDPHNNEWKSLKPMLTARYRFRTFAIQDCIYAVGGLNCSPDTLERYNIAENEWEMIEIPMEMKIKIKESVKIRIRN